MTVTTTAVVPAHDEEETVGAVVREAAGRVDEVLVVDDGSRDRTADVAREAGARVHTRRENGGYVAALRDGFRLARGRVVVTVDADGEFPLEAIPALVEPILSGDAEMVQGARPRPPRPSEAALTRLASLFAPVELRPVDRPRGVAWQHGPQIGCVLAEGMRTLRARRRRGAGRA